MEVFRLIREQYKNQLTGIGASIMGGRWNNKGMRLIYTASNRSLAMAEVAVHLSIGDLPKDYFILTIFVPDNITRTIISESESPIEWKLYPYTDHCKDIGDQFILKNESCVLQVPSAVTRGDYNILINPGHDDFEKIKIVKTLPFPFDHRILRHD